MADHQRGAKLITTKLTDMFFYTESISLYSPKGTVLIKRNKRKAVIYERAYTYGCEEYVKTVVRRDNEACKHLAFDTIERLKQYYSTDLELEIHGFMLE